LSFELGALFFAICPKEHITTKSKVQSSKYKEQSTKSKVQRAKLFLGVQERSWGGWLARCESPLLKLEVSREKQLLLLQAQSLPCSSSLGANRSARSFCGPDAKRGHERKQLCCVALSSRPNCEPPGFALPSVNKHPWLNHWILDSNVHNFTTRTVSVLTHVCLTTVTATDRFISQDKLLVDG